MCSKRQENGQEFNFSGLTVFESPLLHVGLLFIGEAQKTEDAVLKRRHFELCPELLVARMEVASHSRDRERGIISLFL